MPPEIVWTSGAERDLFSLYQHLFDAFDGDTGLIGRILDGPLHAGLNLLRKHPEIAPRVTGSRRCRKKIFGPSFCYGIFYTVESKGIIIHAVLDLRQDPRNIRRRLRGV